MITCPECGRPHHPRERGDIPYCSSERAWLVFVAVSSDVPGPCVYGCADCQSVKTVDTFIAGILYMFM